MADRYSPPESTPASDAEKVVAEIMRRIDALHQWAEEVNYRELGFTSIDDFLKARSPEYVLLKALLAVGNK